QREGDYSHRGEGHGKSCQLRPEGDAIYWIESPCSHWNQQGIVGEGPEDVQLDPGYYLAAELDGGHRIQEVVFHKNYIPGLNSHIRAAAYGYPHIRLRQSGGIIYSVSHKCHPALRLLEPFHLLGLLLGQDLSQSLLNANP